MIILPPTTTPEWDSADASQLAEFLNSRAGRRAIDILADFVPEFLDGSNANKTLVAAGRVQGYQDAIAKLVSLTKVHPTDPTPTPESYPALDDESAWVPEEPTNPQK